MNSRPRHCPLEEFRVAIICAVPREYDAAILAFDEIWDNHGDIRGHASGQYINHKIGRIGRHNVVLALLPGMGKANAASEAAYLRSIYEGLELALLTGICGGVPSLGTDREIVLGDVVVSKSIVQYDLGRQYPGEFSSKDTVDDSLGRPNREIRTLVAILETQLGLIELQRQMKTNLAQIQQLAINAQYRTSYKRPTATQDILFEPNYPHRHQDQSGCSCSESTACERAMVSSCEDLQCEIEHQLPRRRLNNKKRKAEEEDIINMPESQIHIGRIGSGDTVMKSGAHRDRVAQRHGLIAFEMEGAGVWDMIPCIIVKGVCDYADSHKNKKWQDFAAAIAVSATKALLERYPGRDRPGVTNASCIPEGIPVRIAETRGNLSYPVHHLIPLVENRRFVERAEVSDLKRILFAQRCQTVALVGLGGVGKTQIALNIAYWTKENKPEYSVFWVPALSYASFEQAYTDIAKELGIRPNIEGEGDDIKTSVRNFLSSKESGSWLLIVDNADDKDVLYGSGEQSGVIDHLPQSANGITLFTTRVRDLGLSVADDALVEINAMDRDEAKSLLGKHIHRQELLQDQDSVLELLGFLTYLPLAITQASAYLNRNRHISLARYLRLLQGTEQTLISTMSREFRDSTRYPDSPNAIATTWLVSFNQIKESDRFATELLYFISRIESKFIPRSILPCSGSEEDMEYAVGTLCSYAFLVPRDEGHTFDMHSLVHLATRIWTKNQSLEGQIAADALEHLNGIFPSSSNENCVVWRQYMPHTLKVLNEGTSETKTKSDLYHQVGRCLVEDGRVKEAIKLLEHIVEVRETTLDEGHPSQLTSKYELAGAYRSDGRFKDAIELLEHVVEVRERTLDEGHPHRLASQQELAGAYEADGRVKEAITLLEHVVEVRATTLNEGHPDFLASQHELGGAYEADGRFKEAIKLLEHVVEVRATTLDEGHPSLLTSQHELARVYRSDGRIKEAIKLLEHVVEIRSTTLDEGHPSRLTSQHVLARAYQADGRVKEAIKLLEHVVEVRETTLDEGNPFRLTSQHQLGRAYRLDGRFKDAIKLLEHVVEVRKSTLDEMHPDSLASQQELAGAYEADGRVKEAIALLEHVVDVRVTTLEEGHPSRLTSQHELARAYRSNGQVKEAIKLLEYVVKVLESTHSEGHPHRLTSQHELARAYRSDGRFKDSIKLLEHVVEVRESTLDEGHPDQLTSQHELARAYRSDGQVKKAIKLLEHVVEVQESTLNEGHPDQLASQYVLARAYETDGRIKEAIKLLEHVVGVESTTLDEADPDRLVTQRALARAYRSDGRVNEAIKLRR